MAEDDILDGAATMASTTTTETMHDTTEKESDEASQAWWQAMRTARQDQDPAALIALAQETGSSMPITRRGDIAFLAAQDTAFLQALLDAGALRQPSVEDMVVSTSMVSGNTLQRAGLEHIAAAEGRADVLQALHRSGWDLDRMAAHPEHVGRPITLAARGGHIDAMRAAFMAGARTDLGIDTLLAAAAASGDVDVLREAQAYAPDASPATLERALGIALADPGVRVVMVDALLDAGAPPNGLQGSTHRNTQTLRKHPIVLAMGQHDKMETLLRRGSDPLASMALNPEQAMTALDMTQDKVDARGIEILHAHGVATGRQDEMDKALAKRVTHLVTAIFEDAQTALQVTDTRASLAESHGREAAQVTAAGGVTQASVREAAAMDMAPEAWQKVKTSLLPPTTNTEAPTSENHASHPVADLGTRLIAALDTSERLALPIDVARGTLWARAKTFGAILEHTGEAGQAWQKRLDSSTAYHALAKAQTEPAVTAALDTYARRPDLVNQPTIGRMLATTETGRLGPEAIDRMRALGGDLHAKGVDGATAMHLAAYGRNAASIAHLQTLGLDINARDARGHLPASYAVRALDRTMEHSPPETLAQLSQTVSTLETIAALGGSVTDRQNADKRSPVDSLHHNPRHIGYKILAMRVSPELADRLERLKDAERLHKQATIRAQMQNGVTPDSAQPTRAAPQGAPRKDGMER